MTDHRTLKMNKENLRITDKKILQSIIERNTIATVCFHDEPYPYCTPMNYGFEWEEGKLVFYFHMAPQGHRVNLIHQNNKVMLNIRESLDRHGFKAYRDGHYDYRSVNVFGKAKIITLYDQPNEFLKGLQLLQKNNMNREPIKKVAPAMNYRLNVLKITTDYVVGKAKYVLKGIEESEIPENKL